MQYILVVSEGKQKAVILRLCTINAEPKTGTHVNLLDWAVKKNSKFGCLAMPKIVNNTPVELDLSCLIDTDDVYRVFPEGCAVLLTVYGRAHLTPALANEFGIDCPRDLPLYLSRITPEVAINHFV